MPRVPTFHAGLALPLEELREEFDRLWTTLTAAPPLHGWGVRQEAVFPAVNVRESDDAVAVEAELPGLEAGDVAIAVTGNELLLEGARPGHDTSEADEKITWHRRERGTGSFKRRIQLPVAVDASRVEARLVDGVLTVICPKAAECQPRRVEVRSA
jgi:HSP20 family protein